MITYCPSCREEAIFTSTGRCTWCDTVIDVDAPPQPPAPPEPSRFGKGHGTDWLTEKQIHQAHADHQAGKSLRRIAHELAPGTRYTNPNSIATTLSTEWKRRGWPVRSQRDATILASTTHGLLPRDQSKRDRAFIREQRRLRGDTRGVQCAAIKTRPGKGRGEQCQRPALAGEAYCLNHHPDKAADRAAHLEFARSLRKAPA